MQVSFPHLATEIHSPSTNCHIPHHCMTLKWNLCTQTITWVSGTPEMSLQCSIPWEVLLLCIGIGPGKPRFKSPTNTKLVEWFWASESLFQPNIPYRTVLKIKWRRWEWCTLPQAPYKKDSIFKSTKWMHKYQIPDGRHLRTLLVIFQVPLTDCSWAQMELSECQQKSLYFWPQSRSVLGPFLFLKLTTW